MDCRFELMTKNGSHLSTSHMVIFAAFCGWISDARNVPQDTFNDFMADPDNVASCTADECEHPNNKRPFPLIALHVEKVLRRMATEQTGKPIAPMEMFGVSYEAWARTEGMESQHLHDKDIGVVDALTG